MNSITEKEIQREHPLNHHFQLTAAIVFLVVWLADSFVLEWSTFPSESVPLILRLVLASVVFVVALILAIKSHETIFGEGEEPDQVIDTGIMGSVRHPMYLGSMLVYVALFLTTLSIICLLLFGIAFLGYNKMASFEEQQLEKLFGADYRQYKNRVKKWVPKIY
ncbi:MAG: methyltransferase family protein [Candidatus Heimdallarchaeota archaeon]